MKKPRVSRKIKKAAKHLIRMVVGSYNEREISFIVAPGYKQTRWTRKAINRAMKEEYERYIKEILAGENFLAKLHEAFNKQYWEIYD